MPTDICSSQLRSGNVYCDLEFSQLGSGSAHFDLEFTVAGRKEGKREARRE
jgi:hypothetical protein